MDLARAHARPFRVPRSDGRAFCARMASSPADRSRTRRCRGAACVRPGSRSARSGCRRWRSPLRGEAHQDLVPADAPEGPPVRGCILCRGVRSHGLTTGVRGRPWYRRRRVPQVVERTWRSGRRSWSALPRDVAPVAGRSRAAAGVVGGSRLRAAARRGGMRRNGPSGAGQGSAAWAQRSCPGMDRACRTGPAVPARHRRQAEPANRPRDHRKALRR